MNRICVVCGTESKKCICEKCKSTVDVERVCNEIIGYTPKRLDQTNVNPVLEKVADHLEESETLRDVAFELAEELESPRKEYQQIHSIAGEVTYVLKAKRNVLRELYGKCIDHTELSELEKLRLKGLMLDTLYSEYNYFEADDLASEMMDHIESLPWQAAYSLVDFYNKTRRYDESELIIGSARKACPEDVLKKFDELEANCKKYRECSEKGKKGQKEYIPNPKEDKEKIVANYTEFLSSIGIEVQNASKVPEPISKEEYPEPVIISDSNFDSFVAYDFETTGLSSSRDCIIEIGAVKVVNGKVVESKEFIFGEFVKPYKKRLSDRVSELTGITNDDLKNARPMWEIIKDFKEFAGDSILVGFNNASFDSKFLVRAGRYGHVIFDNPQFDVLKYFTQVKKQIGYTGENCKLTTVAESCGIENPAAHRAWADALTTAKLFLKLKEFG